ncbi:hypothetical protein [Paraburkholderia sediminicola]|uniref:hypothetical protein n=1 Tax=Paraburkholderia sediminicola TaxID=458836 RepID=UPI0038B8AC06
MNGRTFGAGRARATTAKLNILFCRSTCGFFDEHARKKYSPGGHFGGLHVMDKMFRSYDFKTLRPAYGAVCGSILGDAQKILSSKIGLLK